MDNKYIKVFLLSIQNSLIYKVNFIFVIISGFVPYIVQFYIWTNIYGKTGDLAIKGYTLSQIVMYLGYSMIISKLVQTNSHYDIADEIKCGNLNHYIVKPISYVKYWICKELGSRFIFSIILNVILFFILFVFEDNYLGVVQVFAGILSYFLGFLLYFMINYNLALLAFWFVEVTQIFSASQLIFLFCSGGVLPLDFFPKLFQDLLKFLPFSLIIYFPTNIFCGKLTLQRIVSNLGLQVLWLIILILLAKYLWKKGLKKYSAFGG